MRFLGNKTKLLPAIETLLAARGIRPPGVLLDAFTGSAAVARRMKQLGWTVIANDVLRCTSVQAQAAVALEGPPELRGVLSRPEVAAFIHSPEGQDAFAATPIPAAVALEGRRSERGTPDDYSPLRAVVAYLNARAPSLEGFVFRQYSPDGAAGRRYFTPEAARRIDGVRSVLKTWQSEDAVTDDEHAVLLAALLDALDRVANVSGTYGAFLKEWGEAARRPLVLAVPFVPLGPAGRVYRTDANKLARVVECDVAYLDPPYNRRQCAHFFHVPEVVAELAFADDERALEADLTGTTGLPATALRERRSTYCEKRARVGTGGAPAERALRELLAMTAAEQVVLSYNEEGVLSREAVARIFAEVFPGFDAARDFLEIRRKRFRSDADKARRRYRVLDGRGRDEVAEWLICARRPRPVVAADGQLAFAWCAKK